MTVALMLLSLVSCSSKKFPTTTIHVGDTYVLVELAVTTEQRARGLMHRASLAKNDGVLFVYPDTRPRSFWMKNTKIPLSIAFIDPKGKILKIAKMQPLVKKNTKSLYPAKYALEMNQGWFEDHSILVGQMVTNIPKDKEMGVE